MIPYAALFRLTRLHKPVGIFLLLWPCLWAATLVRGDMLPLPLILLFALGALAMRTAGCIFNDIIDRDIDKQIERTKNRPIASGEVTVFQAYILFAIFLFIGAWSAWQITPLVFVYASASLPLILLYPFMKRITWWPQLFLGLTFNWGVLLGWLAITQDFSSQTFILYIACVLWTLGYDTIYAFQDVADDEGAGVKSTARRLHKHPKCWIGGFYAMFFFLLLMVAFGSGCSWGTMGLLALCGLQLLWQVKTVDLGNRQSCWRVFASNAWFGALVFAALSLT